MSPPWVFLNRNVQFVDGEFTGGTGRAAAVAAAAAAIDGSCGVWEASLEEVTAALKPNPVVLVDPPEVTSLSMVRPLPKDLMPGHGHDGATVSSTDKGLVALYTGSYQPGADGACGCYLVYDASRSSVAAIPQLDSQIARPTLSVSCLGTSAAILRLRRHGGGAGADEGAYVLAELATKVYPGLPDADLYLWSSSSSSSKAAANGGGGGGQWRRTAARLYGVLPAELCGPTSFFHIDMAFAFGDSWVCWADLLAGVLICDLFAPEGPEFSFVPLPQGCCSYTPESTRPKPEEFRSMGVVCGAIKFVAMVGYFEGLPKEEVVLKTWTLSSDFKEWKEDGAGVLVRDLWEGDSYREMELPERGWPINPALSMNEEEVIYISLCDMEYVKAYDFYGQCTWRELVLHAHYVLRLDLLQNKVLYSKKSATNSLSLLRPFVLASDFSAYLVHCKKDNQRGKEEIEVGTMVKRTKY